MPEQDNQNNASLKTKIGKDITFLHAKLSYKLEMDKFHQIYCKMWMKKFLIKEREIKYTILYCVNFCDYILLRFRNRNLLWFRFR